MLPVFYPLKTAIGIYRIYNPLNIHTYTNTIGHMRARVFFFFILFKPIENVFNSC